MGRILAIDYGQKKVGFAVTDELRICAHALETVHVSKVMEFLKAYIAHETVDVIVVGDPRNMDNTQSDSARYIEPFVKHLQKEFPDMPVVRVDERFTSRMAFQTMIDAGLKQKARRNKELVDKISATIILQSYLQQLEMNENRTETEL